MKKLLSCILAAIMLLSLCACAGNNTEETMETTQPKMKLDATVVYVNLNSVLKMVFI